MQCYYMVRCHDIHDMLMISAEFLKSHGLLRTFLTQRKDSGSRRLSAKVGTQCPAVQSWDDASPALKELRTKAPSSILQTRLPMSPMLPMLIYVTYVAMISRKIQYLSKSCSNQEHHSYIVSNFCSSDKKS